MRTRTRRSERPPPPAVVAVAAAAAEEDGEPAAPASAAMEEDAKPEVIDAYYGSLALVSSGSTDDDDDDEEDGSAAADSSACAAYHSKKRPPPHRREGSVPAPTSPPPLLEASIGGRTVRVRVTPEPKSEAHSNGRAAACRATIRGAASGDDEEASPRRKRVVTWRSPLAEFAREDPATSKLRKLIVKAVRQRDDVRSRDRSVVAALRRVVVAADDPSRAACAAARLGGVRALADVLRRRPGRPSLVAEALGALSEWTWLNSHVGLETIEGDDEEEEEDGGSCLDLAVAAMERHAAHAGVQRMGCGYLRALSHDAACGARLKKSRAVATVADSIRRNPGKVHVVTEGSMFLQNMMVVSSTATAKILLRSNRGRNADGLPSFLSTILSVIQANRTNVDLVSVALGLLSNVALGARGNAVLGKSGAAALAADAVRDHPNSPELLSTAFKLLSNTPNNDGGRRISDLVELALRSMENHPEEGPVQIHSCRLISVILDSQASAARGLVDGADGSRILRTARANFPEGCEDLVDRILS